MREGDWETIDRLLVVWVGEEITEFRPALQALRSGLPNRAITLLTSVTPAQIQALLPLVNNVLEHTAYLKDATAQIKLVKTLSDSQFNAAIIFSNNGQSPYPFAYLCYLAGIAIRIGLSPEFGGGVLSHCVKPSVVTDNPHLYLLKSAGLPMPYVHCPNQC